MVKSTLLRKKKGKRAKEVDHAGTVGTWDTNATGANSGSNSSAVAMWPRSRATQERGKASMAREKEKGTKGKGKQGWRSPGNAIGKGNSSLNYYVGEDEYAQAWGY